MHVRFIPASASRPAIRHYDCGCNYSCDVGWSFCNDHGTVHGVHTAATISRNAAKEAAKR